jgi:hypothetical protein
LLPAIAVLSLLIMEASVRVSMRYPKLWNVPEKARFLAMSEAQREPVYHELRVVMDTIATGVILLVAGVHFTLFTVATRHSSRAPYMIFFFAFLFTIGSVLYALISNARIKHIILSADTESTIGSMG